MNAVVNRGLVQARSYLTSAMIHAGRDEAKRLEAMITKARADVDKAIDEMKNPTVEKVVKAPVADDD